MNQPLSKLALGNHKYKQHGFLRNLLKLEGVTGFFFLRRRKHGPDKQMGCQADISGTLGGTALERGICQFTEVIGNGRRHSTGLPALYLAGLITSHPGSEVTDGLDKEIAVSRVYLDFHNAFYPLEKEKGAVWLFVRNWLETP